jgi:hypothetical protein
MIDITKIAQQELIDDRTASVNDIKVCELALLHGIEEYGSGHSVIDRLIGKQRYYQRN